MNIENKFEIGDTVYRLKDRRKFDIVYIVATIHHDETSIAYNCVELRSGGEVALLKESEITKDDPGPKSVFELKKWDECFYIDVNGHVDMMRLACNPGDNPLFTQGNVFLTLEDAKKELERRKVHQELKKLANGCEFCVGAPNYYIVYEYGRNNFFVESSGHVRMPGTVYFASEDEAWGAIRTIQMDRLMIYLGVGEK